MKKAIVVLGVLLAVGLAGCGKEHWEAMVTPEGPTANAKSLGSFPTLDACRAEATVALKRDYEGAGRYECRKNCKTDPRNTKSTICEEVAT